MSEWLSVPEALKYLSVSRTTLYRWLREGRLRYYTPEGGGRRRLKRSELNQFMRPSNRFEDEEARRMDDDQLAVGQDGVVLLPEDIEQRKRGGDPSSVGGGPDDHEAALIQIEIERSQQRIRGLEERIELLEADLVARGPSEFVEGDLSEARHRLDQLRRYVASRKAEYERLGSRRPGSGQPPR
jgi:excisionase family DNA binding protein